MAYQMWLHCATTGAPVDFFALLECYRNWLQCLRGAGDWSVEARCPSSSGQNILSNAPVMHSYRALG